MASGAGAYGTLARSRGDGGALAPPPLSELLRAMPRPVDPTNGAGEHGWEDHARRQLAARAL